MIIVDLPVTDVTNNVTIRGVKYSIFNALKTRIGPLQKQVREECKFKPDQIGKVKVTR